MNFRALALGVLAAAAPASWAQSEATLGGFRLGEFPAPDAAPIIKLESAGMGTRQALRYRFAAGTAHHAVMTMRMSIGMELDDQPAPAAKVPGMRMGLEARVTRADEQQFRLAFAMRDAELFDTEGVQPVALERMRDNLRHLSSLRAEVAMTSRGYVREANFEMAPGADQAMVQMLQSMRQSITQMSIPLPEQAVGAGGRWKALQQVQASGMTLYQVATFSLERLDGPRATIAVGLEQLSPRQDLRLPDEAKGATAELTEMRGRGKGSMLVDLRSPVPRSRAAIDSWLAMNLQVEGRTLRMRTRLRMQMQLEPAAP